MSLDTNINEEGSYQEESYTPEDINIYYLELERLLERVERATTHYQVLEIDPLATSGEVKIAYLRATALLHPAYYNLELPQPDEMLPRIDNVFEKVSKAYSILVNFRRRVEYDDQLFGRGSVEATKNLVEVNMPEPNVLSEKLASGMKVAVKQETVRTELAPVVASENRRRYERFKLAIPVRVTGRDRNRSEWNETTLTVDVSRGGALLRLRRSANVGDIFHLTMPMPMKLRSYDYFDSSYCVYAMVRRLEPSLKGLVLVGVEFLGEHPTGDFSGSGWDEQTDGIDNERRDTPRRKQTKVVNIEYFDKSLDSIITEFATTENLSQSGMRVRVKVPPGDFELVKVSSKRDKFESYAIVTNRFTGEDGLERLCLQFIDNEWPAA